MPIDRVADFVEHLYEMRRCFMLDPMTSFSVDVYLSQIHIKCSAGRLVQAFVVASEYQRLQAIQKSGRLQYLSFSELLGAGVVEYLDYNEQRSCRIARNEQEWAGVQAEDAMWREATSTDIEARVRPPWRRYANTEPHPSRMTPLQRADPQLYSQLAHPYLFPDQTFTHVFLHPAQIVGMSFVRCI